MIVRLVLNTEDLARLRVSRPLGPLSEAFFSLMQLQERNSTGLIDGWRQLVRGQTARWAPLFTLMPPAPFVDLHTVVGWAGSIEEGLDLLEAAPTPHLRDELDALRPRAPGTAPWARRWLGDLSAGDRQARHELVGLLRDYHRHAVEPYWDKIRVQMAADRAHRVWIAANGGIDQLLSTLHPTIRWDSPFLDVVHRGLGDDSTRTVVLGGRSLVLVPSVFCLNPPRVLHDMADVGSPYVLVYPALSETRDAVALWTRGPGSRRRGLGLVLGETRTRALEAIAGTCTTTELARRIGVSPSTASDHASKLRMAGLIVTRREGGAVLHSLTDLGVELLDGDGRER